MMQSTALRCLTLLATVLVITGHPTGAPDRPSICASMKPGHVNTPQKLPPPFTIEMSKDTYYPGDKITVTIKGKGSFRFKGFLIQARRADFRRNQTEPIGRWEEQAGTKAICRDGNGNGLTHTDGVDGSDSPKNQLQLKWVAPNKVTKGHLEFRVTVVSTYAEYWVAERSAVLADPSAPALPNRQSPQIPDDYPVPDIEVSQCGKGRGCYREPEDCKETCNEKGCEECDNMVMWEDKGDYVDYQISADTDGWVALGFSEDKLMGKDAVVECVWNEKLKGVVVRPSWNAADGKSNEILSQDASVLGLSRMAGFKSNGRVKCVFRREKVVNGQDQAFNLQNSYHLLLGKGDVDEDGFKKMHSLEPNKFPMVSPSKVLASDHDDISGRARYPLVKAHGCLMLVAWMMCGSLAIIMARYYKPMWPNDRFCGQRVWFAIHRGCNLVAMLCTIIAFIIIFIHVGGYSQLPELPASAHPPLGITVTILVILNPLLSLCRCKPGDRLRPLFNWFHWLFGTAAFVLAAPTMFIGMSLYKAFVPWWATWVAVAFFLFHIIIELMLEIHGCINGPKQKSRSAEYELTKQSQVAGYEPDPVGTRFKTTLMSIYLVVMVICGLIMIIAVAAG